MNQDTKIPVTLLTGFLGSGKTTLLNRLLKSAELVDAAVIVNEFGDIGIDHLLVKQASDSIIELSDGCLCCSMQGDLLETLEGLLDRMQLGKIKKISRIIIETTGLADPLPILQLFMLQPLLLHAFALDSVVSVVDGVNGMATLDTYHEAVRQVAVADCLVLSKTDMAAATDQEALRKRLRNLNPHAEIIVLKETDTPPAMLIKHGLYRLENKNTTANWCDDMASTHHDHHHEHHHADHRHHASHHIHDQNRHGTRINAFSLEHDQPLPLSSIEAFIDLLRANYGNRILRLKGLVRTAEKGAAPLVIHGAQGLFHPPQWLRHWPDTWHQTRLVLITDGVAEEEVSYLFDAIIGRPVLDRPDLAALTNNPLAVVGVKF